MTIDAHPDVVRLVELFEENGVAPYESMTVADAREALEQVTRLQGPPAPVADVRDIELPGARGKRRARVYHPDPAQRLPIVLYLHGGGWTLGTIEASDGPCRRLCRAGHCVVVSIDYRLAPESRFPAPLEDCLCALDWLARHGTDVGGDPATLILMGDSAGGNLAAALALSSRDNGGPAISAQILLYPCLFPARESPFDSYSEQAEGPLLTRSTMIWFWDNYLAEPADADNPLAVPLRAENASGLPPTHLFLAELDPLRDEGLAFADKLRAAGVEVHTTVYRGAAHGFWWMDAALSQASELDIELGDVLRTFTARLKRRDARG